MKNFWKKLKRPIIGLSPMDGVTDAPMRFIAKKYGNPDVIYTEFVSAEGLWRIKKRGEMENKIWRDLIYSEIERPVVAQLFGSDPESFYEATKIVCELGFDGVDINMGCPSPGLEKRGGGAGLIRDKCNAKEVVEATRYGVRDFFSSNQSNFSTHLHDSLRQNLTASALAEIDGVSAHDLLRQNQTDPALAEIDGVSAPPERTQDNERLEIPVSVKTRIGSSKPDEEWWKLLASMELPVVAMHGRTFKQLYSGEADWEVLTKAAEIIRESGALFLGNGDVKELKKSKTQELKIMTNFGKEIDLTGKMDGVLIGRGVIGNPWILERTQELKNSRIQDDDIKRKLEVAVEHVKKYEELFSGIALFPIRKHLAKYVSGFDGALELRKKLMVVESAKEVEAIIDQYTKKEGRAL